MLNATRLLEQAVELYPRSMIAGERGGIPRYAYHVDLIRKHAPAGGKVLDVGGGIGAFAPAVALAGYQLTLVDDFGDRSNQRFPSDAIAALAIGGIDIVNVDASSDNFSPNPDSYDIVTSFDSMEHWHRSPKTSLHKMMAALKPGGTMILGLPNCVDLYKRITVPLGMAKWSTMEEWYEQPVFRSHVREADLDDLRYIARDLKLTHPHVFGRNWNIMLAANATVRRLGRMADLALQLFPSLCSDLYLVGKRGGSPEEASAHV